mmetsp:Transcript_117183/g.250410  ORF Transcript_117183/g.250410 Transcript_117183/m.250410 type:complete len:85 (-) Transcript_117183:70-324(-)
MAGKIQGWPGCDRDAAATGPRAAKAELLRSWARRMERRRKAARGPDTTLSRTAVAATNARSRATELLRMPEAQGRKSLMAPTSK